MRDAIVKARRLLTLRIDRISCKTRVKLVHDREASGPGFLPWFFALGVGWSTHGLPADPVDGASGDYQARIARERLVNG